MARVDPDDDSIARGVVWWYRFDAERRCRRNVIVAAFDDEAEWMSEMERLEVDIRILKAEGASEAMEHAGGAWLESQHRVTREFDGALRPRWSRRSKT